VQATGDIYGRERLNSLLTKHPEAMRVGNVGDLLKVDTDSAQESLRESADEIKSQEPESPDYDNDLRAGGGSEICSNA
jgi:hypothetical protein